MTDRYIYLVGFIFVFIVNKINTDNIQERLKDHLPDDIVRFDDMYKDIHANQIHDLKSIVCAIKHLSNFVEYQHGCDLLIDHIHQLEHDVCNHMVPNPVHSCNFPTEKRGRSSISDFV